jgi:hypothetical protein
MPRVGPVPQGPTALHKNGGRARAAERMPAPIVGLPMCPETLCTREQTAPGMLLNADPRGPYCPQDRVGTDIDPRGFATPTRSGIG